MPAPSRRTLIVAGAGLLLASGCSGGQPSQQRGLIHVHGDLAEQTLSQIADAAQAAAQAVVARWGRHGAFSRGRITVRAARDRAQFIAWGGDGADSVAATTTADGEVLMSAQLCAGPAPEQRFVLTHEMTHAVLGVRSKTSHWVTEGAAELTAWKASGLTFELYAPRLAAHIRAGRYFDQPPGDAEFAPESATSAGLNDAYQQACAFSDFLRSLRGEAAYRTFVESAVAGRGDVRSAYGSHSDAFAQPLHDHLRSLVGAQGARR